MKLLIIVLATLILLTGESVLVFDNYHTISTVIISLAEIQAFVNSPSGQVIAGFEGAENVTTINCNTTDSRVPQPSLRLDGVYKTSEV